MIDTSPYKNPGVQRENPWSDNTKLGYWWDSNKEWIIVLAICIAALFALTHHWSGDDCESVKINCCKN